MRWRDARMRSLHHCAPPILLRPALPRRRFVPRPWRMANAYDKHGFCNSYHDTSVAFGSWRVRLAPLNSRRSCSLADVPFARGSRACCLERCSASMNRPKAFSPTSSTKSATSSSDSTARWDSPCSSSSRNCRSRGAWQAGSSSSMAPLGRERRHRGAHGRRRTGAPERVASKTREGASVRTDSLHAHPPPPPRGQPI
jgi:hypothetical protein